MLYKFWCGHRDHLGSKGNILLYVINAVSVLDILGQHFEFVTLTMRYPRVDTVFDPVLFEVETAANQQFHVFAVCWQV